MTSILKVSSMALTMAVCLVQANASRPTSVRFTNYPILPNMIASSIFAAVTKLELEKQAKGKLYQAGSAARWTSNGWSHAHRYLDPVAVSQMNDNSFLTVQSAKELVRRTNTPLPHLQSDPNVVLEWRKQINSICSTPIPQCNPNDIYRSADGTCNNLENPTWGSSMRPYLRYLPAAYDDGKDTPRQHSVNGGRLFSPRVISNVLHSTGRSDLDEGGRSVLLMSWGTITALDLLGTSVSQGLNNSDITCCPVGQSTADQIASCFPIKIPKHDRRFRSNCMNFVRSATAPSPMCDMDVRNQINEQTSYIDASMIYGSTQATQNRLRQGNGGFLKTGPGSLLPPADDSTCILSNPGEFCFDAGDQRNTLVPSLAALYTVLVREHNRIAKQLHYYNPLWSDEKLFQETRKIIAAFVQHINYNEYLPHVLSDIHMRVHGLYSSPRGYNNVYNPKLNPTAANVFGAAAFRFGHSSVPSFQGIKDLHTQYAIQVPTELTYLRPNLLFADNGQGVDKVNFWQLNSIQAKQDRFFQDATRNELFLNESGDALDLAAINIQRGRDHGLPSYNAWRKWCGLHPALHFRASPGGLIHHDPLSAILLSKVYKHPDDIDLYTGGLSEAKIKGSITGPTFSCIIAKQFQLLKEGDRFWYEHNLPGVGFTAATKLLDVNLYRESTYAIGLNDPDTTSTYFQ